MCVDEKYLRLLSRRQWYVENKTTLTDKIIYDRFRKYEIRPTLNPDKITQNKLCNLCLNDNAYEYTKKSTRYCFECKIIDTKSKRTFDVGIRESIPMLKEFVNRVEDRNGFVSLDEIFVELITLYQYFGNNYVIDSLSVREQIIYMWQYLKVKKLIYDRNTKI